MTRKMTQKRVKDILARLGDVGDVDRIYLEGFFRKHPKYHEKFKDYANKMVVKTKFGSNGVHLVNRNGTHTAISTNFDPDPKAYELDRIHQAFRNAIKRQVYQFELQTVRCDLCNKKIMSTDKTHVDHVVEFRYLRDTFLEQKSMRVDDVQVGKVFDNRLKMDLDVITDDALRQEWSSFHKQNALLRRVHARCNLKRKRA